MKKDPFEREKRWKDFKDYTLPMALHFITGFLTLILAVIGLINITSELDTSFTALSCFFLLLGVVIFNAWATNIHLDNYRNNIISRVTDNIEKCESLNLTADEKESLIMIATKNI